MTTDSPAVATTRALAASYRRRRCHAEADALDGTLAEYDQLRTEFSFVLARAEAQQNHVRPRCWGISSTALAMYALGRGRYPDRVLDFPSDEDDLGACERTYAMAPAHLQERMLPVLEKFRSHVRDRRNRHGEVAQ